jgi:hypothetical protein
MLPNKTQFFQPKEEKQTHLGDMDTGMIGDWFHVNNKKDLSTCMISVLHQIHIRVAHVKTTSKVALARMLTVSSFQIQHHQSI